MLKHALSIAALTFVSLASAQTPPATPVAPPKADVKKEEAPTYDEKADAKADIAAALVRAKRENKRVLIQWGANWCSWCNALHRLMKSDKALAHEVLYEYEIVHVDVGEDRNTRFKQNLDLAVSYGAKWMVGDNGVPYLTVLDADGKVLVNQETGPLELEDKSKGGHDPKKVLDFLTAHQAAALDAHGVFDAALARAKSEGKHVFLHFGAPWCHWCHELENWIAQKDVTALLARDYVDVKIDVDRMTNAKDILARFPEAANEGIPWFAMLDASGATLANSMLDKHNIGFPSADNEIAHFLSMLEKSRQNLKPDDLTAIQKSLVAWREKAKS